VRRDSGLTRLEDLRGKTIAFVDPASSSGYIYPMVLLMQRGLVQKADPKTFFREVVFSGAHDASMRALLNGHVDAIASFDLAREQYLADPAERERITWVAETEPIPEAGIAASAGLDPATFARVRAALLQIRGPAYAPCSSGSTRSTGSRPPTTTTTIPCGRRWTCSASARAEPSLSPNGIDDRGRGALRRAPARHGGPRRHRSRRRAGEFVVILGRSGAGKTTFLRSINRLIDPTAGVIRVAGRAVTGASAAELRQVGARSG